MEKDRDPDWRPLKILEAKVALSPGPPLNGTNLDTTLCEPSVFGLDIADPHGNVHARCATWLACVGRIESGDPVTAPKPEARDLGFVTAYRGRQHATAHNVQRGRPR
jgi:hypothetical protein